MRFVQTQKLVRYLSSVGSHLLVLVERLVAFFCSAVLRASVQVDSLAEHKEVFPAVLRQGRRSWSVQELAAESFVAASQSVVEALVASASLIAVVLEGNAEALLIALAGELAAKLVVIAALVL